MEQSAAPQYLFVYFVGKSETILCLFFQQHQEQRSTVQRKRGSLTRATRRMRKNDTKPETRLDVRSCATVNQKVQIPVRSIAFDAGQTKFVVLALTGNENILSSFVRVLCSAFVVTRDHHGGLTRTKHPVFICRLFSPPLLPILSF